MDVSQKVKQAAEVLWDLLVADPNASGEETQAHLQEQGLGDISPREFELALDRIESRLPADSASGVAPLRASAEEVCSPGPIELSATFVTPAPVVNLISAAAPARFEAQPAPVVRNVTQQNITEKHVTEQHITRSVTEQNITNNFLREGDTNTSVDNRVLTEINARGDVVFDQKVTTETVLATKGGVSVNGDIQGSAVNTGVNTGVVAGDDVNLSDSVVGDGNTQLNDSEVGAFAGRGPATNITGENVNAGSGDLVDVQSQGDAQVVSGNRNAVDGATDVSVNGTDGPTSIAVGDENRQQATEDSSDTTSGSGNVDNSVEGSANTALTDSGNTLTQDNDLSTVAIENSGNTSTFDNDTTTDSFQSTNSFDADPLTAFDSGGDVDMDFDN